MCFDANNIRVLDSNERPITYCNKLIDTECSICKKSWFVDADSLAPYGSYICPDCDDKLRKKIYFPGNPP